MKNQLFILMFLISIAGFAQTATNFTCNDCSGNTHDLYTELNAGKVIVLCWVMPCSACVGGSLTTYNVVQSYASSHPNTVYMYLCDDYANTPCSSVNSWANANGLTNAVRFSNASINMNDYGSTGMPKVVVVGGENHTVFYNADNVISAGDLQNAINAALSVTGISEAVSNVSSMVVFPDPAPASASLNISLLKTSESVVELFNSEGKLVECIFKGILNGGETRVNLSLEKIPAGMYFIRFTDGKSERVINFIRGKQEGLSH
ncbi:MAG: T9SS type A sorting domain-containing protein [Bacteroidia bacterium]|nr:T9SS type A sorting domain-containing protein [Bacteroidia bacterium]